MKNWMERLERFWCAKMHGRPMWPVHGRYQCAICLREFPVAFEHPGRDICVTARY
jgi:hypothetical protein